MSSSQDAPVTSAPLPPPSNAPPPSSGSPSLSGAPVTAAPAASAAPASTIKVLATAIYGLQQQMAQIAACIPGARRVPRRLRPLRWCGFVLDAALPVWPHELRARCHPRRLRRPSSSTPPRSPGRQCSLCPLHRSNSHHRHRQFRDICSCSQFTTPRRRTSGSVPLILRSPRSPQKLSACHATTNSPF
jgi:hypothetical protein